MYKRHNWMKYGRFGNIIKIEIADDSERQTDRFVCNTEEEYNRVLRLIEKKYGFKVRPEVDKKDSINEIKKEKDWLEKDMSW